MKIGLLLISLNEPYWQYTDPLIESARKHLFKGIFDIFLFTDEKKERDGIETINIDSMPHPYPTLLRYHTFLIEEQRLRDYDYLFFCDIDMLFVDDIGDEILGDGITATRHPGYAFPVYPDPEIYFLPLEPNPESTAYVPYPKMYFAGGFQGGKTESFLKAMWTIRRNIDADFSNNYIARWHDESHWNRYLIENPPAVILNPSYCYPDGMIEQFYKKIWCKDYPPKLMCLTKKFSLTKGGLDGMNDILKKIS